MEEDIDVNPEANLKAGGMFQRKAEFGLHEEPRRAEMDRPKRRAMILSPMDLKKG